MFWSPDPRVRRNSGFDQRYEIVNITHLFQLVVIRQDLFELGKVNGRRQHLGLTVAYLLEAMLLRIGFKATLNPVFGNPTQADIESNFLSPEWSKQAKLDVVKPVFLLKATDDIPLALCFTTKIVDAHLQQFAHQLMLGANARQFFGADRPRGKDGLNRFVVRR